jgi:Flp pilus assembly protein TadD
MTRKMAALAGTILFTLSAPSLAQDRSSCLEAKDYVKAVRACSDIIRSHPKDASAYHMRGTVLAKNGDLGQAIADYTKAIEISPNFAAAYNSRAEAYVAKGDYAHAVSDVTKAGEVDSRKAHPVKAKVAVKPKPKVAARAATKTIDAEPKEPFNPFPK